MISNRKIMIKQDATFTKPLLFKTYNLHNQQLLSQTKKMEKLEKVQNLVETYNKQTRTSQSTSFW